MNLAAVRPWLAVPIVAAIVILAGTTRSTSGSAVVPEQSETPRMFRWMLVHRPDRAYERTAQIFAEELPRLSGGRLNIQMLPKADRYVDVPEDQVFEFVNDGLRSGDADMMTVYLKDVEAIVPELQTVNLPFVFEDYAAVEKFLESPVAEELKAMVSAKTGVHVLTFTFSGGFRVIMSDKAIKTPEDLKGLRVGTTEGEITQNYLRSLGAVPVRISRYATGEELTAQGIDTVETGFIGGGQRRSPNAGYINATEHSLVMSMLIMRKEAWNALSPEDQEALEAAATIAGKIEREDSRALSDFIEKWLIENGMQRIEASAPLREAMRAHAGEAFKDYETRYGADLLNKVREAASQ